MLHPPRTNETLGCPQGSKRLMPQPQRFRTNEAASETCATHLANCLAYPLNFLESLVRERATMWAQSAPNVFVCFQFLGSFDAAIRIFYWS